MKRFTAFLLALMLAFSMTPQVLAQTEVPDTGNYDFDTESPGVDYDEIDVEDFLYKVTENKVTIIGYTGEDESVRVPNKVEGYPVTEIGASAFADCGALVAVTMGESVTAIGSEAFLNCVSLESVTIPGSVTTIGAGAFTNCTALTYVKFIGTQAQWQNVAVGEDNEALQTAQIHYTHLDGGTCGETVTWVFDDEGTLTVSGEGAMYDYGYNGNGGLNAPWKQYSESIKAVVVGDLVTHVGSNAFDNLPNLVTATIGEGVSTIGEAAFGWSTSLAKVTLPAGLEVIGTQAFTFCPLTEITLPEGLTDIGLRAFYQCGSLTKVAIPASVTQIAGEAFFQCGSLTQIQVAAGNENYSSKDGVLYNKAQTEIIQIPGGISGAFTFPDGFERVPENAFRSSKKLTSVTIPDGVTAIGEQAFANSGIKVLYLPVSVTNIDYDIFYNCENAIDVYYAGTEEQWNAIDIAEYNEELFGATIHYNYVAAGTCGENLTWALDSAYTLTVFGEGAMEDYGVRGNSNPPWQQYWETVHQVVIADRVTYVGKSAFSNFYGLTTVQIGANVTAIGESAFYNCDGLTTVTIADGVTEIGAEAFFHCDSLTQIHVAAGNENYSSKDGILYNKAQTEIVQIPGGVSGAFTFPGGVDTVPVCGFYHTQKLTSVALPAGVTTIGEQAFADSNIQVLYLPDSVTTIDNYVLSGCEKLTDIYYAGTQAQWAAIAIAEHNGELNEVNIHFEHGLQHVYSKKVTEPTCTAKGYTTYTCTCGDTYKADEVKALGHSYTNACDTTCNRAGCGATRTITHNYAAATCTAAKTCKVCGATSGSALGHSWGSWTVTKKATCAATGSKRTVCTRCSMVVTKAIAKLTTHTYSNTCDTTCNVCSAKRTIKHTYTNSCDTACNVCSAKRTITHTYKNILIKATFTAKGKIVRKCAVCGKVASTSYISNVKTVKLSATSYTYNGKVKTPAVTVKDAEGNTLMKGTDYTVTYASGRKNAGTYKVVVKMLGNYTGTKTLTFKIKPISISKCTVKLKTTSYTYNGKVRTPLVIAKDAAGNALENGTDYTVTYASGRKNVGQFKVTVKMKGNYSGSKTLTFKILPKAASIKKLTAKSKAFKVSLNTVTSQSTGYQIQYSTSSKFTSAKTVTVNGYKTSSKTISGLKKGKKYYVRVRTFKIVGSAKYYSGWSSYKTVKTK